MNLPLFIARRYLFARKSHNVINIISAISAIGMAIGTAALVIILSVYNGFDGLVRNSLGNVEPDILIAPSHGKTFVPAGPAFDWAYEQESVLNMSSVLEENVYLSYDGHGGIARAKGVDSVYEEESPLGAHMVDGKYVLHHGQVPMGVVGAGLAYKTGINPRFLAPIQLYFPSRTRPLSMSNPAASLDMVKVFPAGIFSVNTEVDSELIVLPIEKMRELLGLTDEVSGVEIRLDPGAGAKELMRLIDGLSERLGPDFRVLDRFRQNPSLYKMMRYEKAAVFLILLFVILIIALNIFGSLSMLIIEKEDDIRILGSMGAGGGLIRRIFVLEGWMISLLGMGVGLLVGLGFCFLQQASGIIKMPGSFLSQPYPVVVQAGDIAVIAASIAIVGYLIALLPARRVAA